MTDRYFPACCTHFSNHWPWPQALDDIAFTRCQFDATQWLPEQFTQAGIPPARGLAKRQTEFLAGRICAREAIYQLCSSSSSPAVGDDGAPLWPNELVGSISHGHSNALAVVGQSQRWQGLGIDLEKQLSPQRAERLAHEILTPAEWQRLQLLPQEQHAWLITLSFSLKESLFKALYPIVQKRFYFHDAELLRQEPNGQAWMTLLIDLHPQWPAHSQLQGQFTQLGDNLLSLIAIAH